MIPMNRSLSEVVEILRKETGVDFSDYRPETIENQLRRRMEWLGIDEPRDYLHRLRTDRSEPARLVEDLLIRFSTFFRDPLVFETLAALVLPRLVAARRDCRALRIWSAGCGAGEEAYSIAILVYEALKREAADWSPLIFATDISVEGLRAAKAACYSRESLQQMKLKFIDRYFIEGPDGFKLLDFIRNMVRFSSEDLLAVSRFAPADSVFGGFDMVLCRNVLVYYHPDRQRQVMEKILRSLRPGGCLVLGDCEAATTRLPNGFRPVDACAGIFQKDGELK